MTGRRKSIPLRAKLEAALRQLGFEPTEVELDHDPALALRPIDPATGDTIPPASDPRFLVWRPRQEHRVKTTGRRGESDLSIRDGDQQKIAKTRRREKKRLEREAASAALPAPPPGRMKAKPPSRWAKRPLRSAAKPRPAADAEARR